MRDPSAFVEIDVLDGEFYWMNYVTGISFDGEEFAIPHMKTLTDTGATCTYMPSAVYKAIVKRIKERVAMTKYYGTFWMNCADVWMLPKIEILFGGYWLEFGPDDYVIEEDGTSGECMLCILEETETPDEALLGNGFLRGFYSTHDL